MERYRTTLIMLALLAVLAVTALLVNNNRGGGDVTATPTAVAARYVWESQDLVQAVEIVSGTQRVGLRQDALGGWSLTSPVQGAADSFTVQSLADSLKSLQATNVLTESTNLADFGLQAPGLTVTTTYSGTTTPRVLNVGAPTFDGAGYYVKTSDAATVYVVSNQVIEPIKSWLTTPPLAPPTPVPFTVVPTAAETATVGATMPLTGTTPASATITGTTEITGTNPITSTAPGAANPTTPEPAGTPVP